MAPYPDDPRYWVTSEGHVWSTVRGGRWLRPGCMNKFGHVTVALGRGNSKCVHAMVLRTFVGPRPPKHDVAHLNGVGGDNRLENLAYKTRAENNADILRHGRYRLTIEQANTVRQRIANGEMGKALAVEYGLSEAVISKIKLRRAYKC